MGSVTFRLVILNENSDLMGHAAALVSSTMVGTRELGLIEMLAYVARSVMDTIS